MYEQEFLIVNIFIEPLQCVTRNVRAYNVKRRGIQKNF